MTNLELDKQGARECFDMLHSRAIHPANFHAVTRQGRIKFVYVGRSNRVYLTKQGEIVSHYPRLGLR